MHQCEVGADTGFQHVSLPVEFTSFFWLGVLSNRAVGVVAHRQTAISNLGADTGNGVKRWDTCATSAHTLGQSALRSEFHSELASQVTTRVLLVESNVGANGVGNETVFEQQAQAEAISTQVIGHDGEVIWTRSA